MPHGGYWQQDVHYTIDANIDEETNIVSGKENLVYWNNSPHDLDVVYFHLYQNAFQPDSYYDKLQKSNKANPKYGVYEREKKGTIINSIKVNGIAVETILDNTILKVTLNQPIKKGESVVFDINFDTYFDNGGTVRRRMKKYDAYGEKHYNGVHWYPRISVYDRKFGWTTDQHLRREFYGDFGTYDVSLTFASNFVLDATGFLVNRNEVLPPDLRKKLDIRNFYNKEWESEPSTVIPYEKGKTKTWIFHAENVHDFAFTADPNYRIGEAEWNGVKCIALVQEPHASGWLNAANYTAKIIELYSNDIGMYTYHKIIVADARDGMEYPMLTLDGGYDPEYRSLLAHEIGHNWFFGQIGNNETYRATLDEGFTQFLTAWAMVELEGDTMTTVPEITKYQEIFRDKPLSRYSVAYKGYMKDAVRGNDPGLNVHSDGFSGNLIYRGGYRHVYYKTATMLYNLQYVLGDELFLDAIKSYFSQWKIAHPYVIDFRNSIINYTKVDLNWFFDQWFESSKSIDYAVKSIFRKGKSNDYVIKLKRKGRMQMPIDFTVYTEEGKKYDFHIPNTWFEKKTDATILPKWTGWDNLNKEYDASITVPGKIKKVIIDTTNRLADIYQLDNSNSLAIKYSFDSKIKNPPDIRYYEVKARPDVWYNGYDGIKTGLHVNGNYMNYLHKFDLTVWFNSGLVKQDDNLEFDFISYRFNYKTALTKLDPKTHFSLNSKALDGLYSNGIGIERTLGKSRLYAKYQSLIRPKDSDLNYLIYKESWNSGVTNNFINVGLNHKYKYKHGTGNITTEFRSSSLASYYSYSKLTLEAINNNKVDKFVVRTRAFAQYGVGSKWAPESKLYLAGGNPEEMMDNKYVRSTGFFDPSWYGYGVNTNHFQYGGGLNLRGYAGYLVPYKADDGGDLLYTYNGTTGAAFNLEIEFDKFFRINTSKMGEILKINSYVFADAGIIDYNSSLQSLKFADIRMDAGVGLALTIKKWWVLEDIKPLTIRFDMPLFLNRIPAVTSDYFEFRWVIGVKRAF